MQLIIIRYNRISLLIRYILLLGVLITMFMIVAWYKINNIYPRIMFVVLIALYVVVKYCFNMYKSIGEIILDEDKITIKDDKVLTINMKPDFIDSIEIYKSGYKGELYKYNFSINALLAAKSGMNKISFLIKNGSTIKKKILIKTEDEFYNRYRHLVIPKFN